MKFECIELYEISVKQLCHLAPISTTSKYNNSSLCDFVKNVHF